MAYGITFIVVKRNYRIDIPKEKYGSTNVSDAQLDMILQKAKTRLVEEKMFTDGDLSLRGLSEQLKISPQILSLAVNKRTGQNFNYLINSLRIEEAKILLRDETYGPQTIAAIGFDVGFNSISSFNTAFKKQVGLTPAQYRNSI